MQCVHINGTISDFLFVISGVPKGSILGHKIYGLLQAHQLTMKTLKFTSFENLYVYGM